MDITQVENVVESTAKSISEFASQTEIDNDTFYKLKHIVACIQLHMTGMHQSIQKAERKIKKESKPAEPQA